MAVGTGDLSRGDLTGVLTLSTEVALSHEPSIFPRPPETGLFSSEEVRGFASFDERARPLDIYMKGRGGSGGLGERAQRARRALRRLERRWWSEAARAPYTARDGENERTSRTNERANLRAFETIFETIFETFSRVYVMESLGFRFLCAYKKIPRIFTFLIRRWGGGSADVRSRRSAAIRGASSSCPPRRSTLWCPIPFLKFQKVFESGRIGHQGFGLPFWVLRRAAGDALFNRL